MHPCANLTAMNKRPGGQRVVGLSGNTGSTQPIYDRHAKIKNGAINVRLFI